MKFVQSFFLALLFFWSSNTQANNIVVETSFKIDQNIVLADSLPINEVYFAELILEDDQTEEFSQEIFYYSASIPLPTKDTFVNGHEECCSGFEGHAFVILNRGPPASPFLT